MIYFNGKMAKEDLLGVEMGKLEIQPIKPNLVVKDDNPFTHQKLDRCLLTRSSNNKYRCSCILPKKYVNPTISKKRNVKVLREPVLKLLQNSNKGNHEKGKFEKSSDKTDFLSQNLNPDILSLCALVDDCNQLRISSNIKKTNDTVNPENKNYIQWWKNEISHARVVRKSVAEPNQGSSCSQQALNPPCDVTIDELASYFETLVHIPKKMSSMAEMMYI